MSNKAKEELAELLESFEPSAYLHRINRDVIDAFKHNWISIDSLNVFQNLSARTVEEAIKELRKPEPSYEEIAARTAEYTKQFHEQQQRIHDLFADALTADGAHHKQWYIWQIAKEYGVNLSDVDAPKGIAP